MDGRNGCYKTICHARGPFKSKERTNGDLLCFVEQHNKTAGTKFIKAINEMNEVIECYNISGEFDFMLKVVEENMDSYYDFHVNRLSEIENIGNVQSTFVMGVVKQTHVMV